MYNRCTSGAHSPWSCSRLLVQRGSTFKGVGVSKSWRTVDTPTFYSLKLRDPHRAASVQRYDNGPELSVGPQALVRPVVCKVHLKGGDNPDICPLQDLGRYE